MRPDLDLTKIDWGNLKLDADKINMTEEQFRLMYMNEWTPANQRETTGNRVNRPV